MRIIPPSAPINFTRGCRFVGCMALYSIVINFPPYNCISLSPPSYGCLLYYFMKELEEKHRICSQCETLQQEHNKIAKLCGELTRENKELNYHVH